MLKIVLLFVAFSASACTHMGYNNEGYRGRNTDAKTRSEMFRKTEFNPNPEAEKSPDYDDPESLWYTLDLHKARF